MALAAKMRVAGEVDLPHAAGSDEGSDFVHPNAVAGCGGHRVPALYTEYRPEVWAALSSSPAEGSAALFRRSDA